MPKQTLDQFADKEAEARFAENQEIARTLRVTRTQLREQEAELEELRGRLGLYEQMEGSRLEPPEWLTPKLKAGKRVAIPTLLLTDIHWGERVFPEQVGDVNAFDVAIAQRRTKRVFERAVLIADNYFAGLEYEGLSLLLGGDIVSGIIHEELRETNEETVFASIFGVVETITAGVNLLAERFPFVHIAAVVGNHGRLTRKPRAKHRAVESLDWLVYQMLAKELVDNKTVSVQVAEAADCRFEVYDTRYCLTHGDQFRGGHGIAAAMSPLLLGVHRKMKREASVGRPFDVLVMGHWHYSYFLHDLIVGGSIKGYDEHAYTKNLPYEEPRAAIWLNTPEHGITMYGPIFASDRKAEGW